MFNFFTKHLHKQISDLEKALKEKETTLIIAKESIQQLNEKSELDRKEIEHLKELLKPLAQSPQLTINKQKTHIRIFGWDSNNDILTISTIKEVLSYVKDEKENTFKVTIVTDESSYNYYFKTERSKNSFVNKYAKMVGFTVKKETAYKDPYENY